MLDGANDTAATSVDAGTEGNDIGSDGGGDLQQHMTDDFFYDDGSDSVVDKYGVSQLDKDGNVIRSMDDFSKLGKGNQQPAAGTKPGTGKNNNNQNGGTKLQPGFDSVFQKDGQFNFDGVVKTASSLKNFSYQMQNVFKNPGAGQSGSKQPVDPKEHIRTTIDGLRNQLTTERLDPIKNLYDGIYSVLTRYGENLPAGLDDEIHRVVNSEFINRKGEIEKAIDQKRDELIGEAVSAQSKKADMKAAEQNSSANFKKVADSMIPHVPQDQREDKLTELIFGHTGADGKFVRGYGADIIEALFDASTDGRSFETPDEWKSAYNEFWFKFSSNPVNVQLIANIAFSRYVASNHDKYRDEYRRAWESELAKKGRNKHVNSRGGNALPNGSTDDALFDYHRAPKGNMR